MLLEIELAPEHAVLNLGYPSNSIILFAVRFFFFLLGMSVVEKFVRPRVLGYS